MTRRALIERIRRQIYNGQPSDDATITVGLVNNYLNDAIAFAAKTNYIENVKLDGIASVNNGFYCTFKNISVTQDEQFTWKVQLPQIPVGLGDNEGLSTLSFKDYQSNQLSQTVIWITENQRSYFDGMRPIPNKLLAYNNGDSVYVKSTLLLFQYTAQVTMVSGGLSTDLSSTVNVPPDYFGGIMTYMQQQFLLELNQPKDLSNDGEDFRVTT